MTTATDEIKEVTFVSRDGSEYIVTCPHCGSVIGIEGDDLSEIRGEQYQHRVPRPGRDPVGCGGWMQISQGARYVKELPSEVIARAARS